jgi:purine-binding chemotaxis protein CheW
MNKYETVDLQALWDELNQSDDIRQQENLQIRLQQRARQYATPQQQEEIYAETEIYHMLVFRLGKERYGIDVTQARGVRPSDQLTRVPGVPAFYRGVINVRGRIITVLDLRLFFNVAGQ